MRPTLAQLPPRVVTLAIERLRAGHAAAEGEIWSLLYEHVRARAQQLLCHDGLATLLSPTDVVHDAYGKLRPTALGSCSDRWHVLRLATRAMRQVLVEAARRRGRRLATLHWQARHFDDLAAGAVAALDDRLDIALALDALAAVNPLYAEVVSLRHYGGLSVDETASSLGIARRSVNLAWFRARAWLRDRLTAPL